MKASHTLNQRGQIAELVGWRMHLQTALRIGNHLPYSGLLPRCGNGDAPKLDAQCASDAAGAVASLQDFHPAEARGPPARDDSSDGQFSESNGELYALVRDLTALGRARIKRATRRGPGVVPRASATAPIVFVGATNSDVMWPGVEAMWAESSQRSLSIFP